ncbi:MAG: hypothetical protein PWR06_2327 [Thermoanaerobacteraceae bacterium]|jgi:predicted transcriptional regulator|uniref:DUF2250 domain-containing protein n=1 Tax=Biomaibacter acetigenes TaxID=2316383 RepID=A0A3G2R443_9FIRM|nr:DUF2250 domain-containing protein [Biomaibacter acetigenes]AYO29697.1 DUF2250 domain-containing protein [Biomaibacter acetigenes]MDK2879611.1 hypothetical protein [Thermoanaerobacteraceae bacterium]MDN5311933.1 hypothetical protein [Thermoanaerobacteraceae bacterium]
MPVNNDQDELLDLTILTYLKKLGPEYAKLLAIRLGLSLEESRKRLQSLEERGLIKRVERRIVKYYHRRRKSVKHRNHTYYELTREGEFFLRQVRKKIDINFDIEYPNR